MQVHQKAHSKSEGTDNMTLFYWSYKFCQQCCTWRTHTPSHKYDVCKQNACMHTQPYVYIYPCNTSTCNRAWHTGVNVQFLAVVVEHEGFDSMYIVHGATLSSTPRSSRSDQSVSGICCPSPAPPPSPHDPPLFSNHPCSGMSHPCSVPKETPSVIDQPHTDTVQYSFHWKTADLYKTGPYVSVHAYTVHMHTHTHIHTCKTALSLMTWKWEI